VQRGRPVAGQFSGIPCAGLTHLTEEEDLFVFNDTIYIYRERERERERELYSELSITGGLGRRPRTDSASLQSTSPHTLGGVAAYMARLSPDSEERLAGWYSNNVDPLVSGFGQIYLTVKWFCDRF
jgi:hypothetical protein